MSVSPTLVKRFNQAAAFAREGEQVSAIAAYTRLLGEPLPEGECYEATPAFVATIEMRRAWCFMDLERHEEARAVLEGSRLCELLGSLAHDDRYEYFFSYGNVLGHLGSYDAMSDAMDEAFTAALELDDEERFLRAWNWRETWRSVFEATTQSLCPSLAFTA